MPTRVKICGLTTLADVESVNAAKSDYAGFVFYEKSRRYIGFERAKELLGELDDDIRSVAVCVNPDRNLVSHIEALGFDRIQIHGEMTDQMLDWIHIPVWQAVNLAGREQLHKIRHHPNICGYLIDGAKFGSGRTFGWENDGTYAALLSAENQEKKNGENDIPGPEEIREAVKGNLFLLAGGLTPDNVRTAIRIFSPDVVDVSSGVERSGEEKQIEGKDRDLIFRFVNEVRKG